MNLGIIGAGTWGMALARMLSNSGHQVQVWSANGPELDRLAATRVQKNLPNMIIPEAVTFTKEMKEVCTGKDMLVFAVPSVYVREAARLANPYITDGQIVVDVGKGIEAETLMTLSEVIADEIKADIHVVALSGPTHAEEVAQDLPSAIVSACKDIAIAEKVQDAFMNSCMRVYTNTDVKGVELCGAMKNISLVSAGSMHMMLAAAICFIRSANSCLSGCTGVNAFFSRKPHFSSSSCARSISDVITTTEPM